MSDFSLNFWSNFKCLENKTLSEIHEEIKNGVHKEQIQKIRDLLKKKENITDLKKNLDSFTVLAIFDGKGRKLENVKNITVWWFWILIILRKVK